MLGASDLGESRKYRYWSAVVINRFEDGPIKKYHGKGNSLLTTIRLAIASAALNLSLSITL